MLHIDHSQILIKDLRIFAHHGALPQERTVGAYFIINVGISTDLSRAMKSDALDDTISYAEVFEVIKTEMAVPSALLERVAGRICDAIFDHFPTADTIHLEILKENPPMGAQCRGAGVSLTISNKP